MARNGSGAYSKVNTFVSGASITAAGHNQNWDDAASELTNSLALDGQSTMTGAFKAANGTVAAPGITFGSDLDSGWYRIGANNLGLALNGAKVLDYSTTGVAVTGTFSATGAGTFAGVTTTTITASDTITSSAATASFPAFEGISTDAGASGPIFSLYHNSASPAASDIIGAYNYYGKDSGGTKTLYGQTRVTVTNTTDASEAADFYIVTKVAGSDTTVLQSSGTNILVAQLTSSGAVSGTNITASGALSGATAAGSMIASQAEQVTGSATDKIVVPGRQHHHQSACKAWVRFDASGSAATNYNVSSVSDNGTGDWTVNIGTDFAGNYVGIFSSSDTTSATDPLVLNQDGSNVPGTGTFRLAGYIADVSGTRADVTQQAYAGFFGDQ